MKPHRILLALLLLVPALTAQESESTVAAIVKEGREHPQVMNHLDHLVNQIGPRLTSSDNLTKACEWSRDRFAFWGLDARLEKWGEFPVGFNRGPWTGSMTAPVERKLTFCTPSWTPGTDGPLSARVVMAPTSEEEIDREKLKGAWVLQAAPPRRELRETLDKVYDECGIAGLVRCVRFGKGELIITDGNPRISWEKLPRRILIDMVKSDFDAVASHVRDGKEVLLTFDIQNEFKKGPIELFNVVADLKGTEKPEEFVVIGGHIDSWDGARGAVDNGTGCATTLEAARLLVRAGARPKRTIRFLLWGGEEQGLLGSAAYVKSHRDEMKHCSAVFVHDGGTNALAGIAATEKMVPLFEKVFAPVMTLDETMPFKLRKVSSIPRGGASDHASFIAAGVPGFFWDQRGRANYNHAHHTQHDHFDQAVPEYQKHSAIVAALAAWGVANLDDLLPRDGVGAGGGGEGRPRRVLGVQLDDSATGVTGVVEESPAETAGIREGDVLVSIDGRKIEDYESLRNAIGQAKPVCKIVVRRDGKEVELDLKFREEGGEEPPRRMLGVQLDGLTVSGVMENSVAAVAGILEDDEILKIDGIEVEDYDELREAIQKAKKECTIVVFREGKELELAVKFDR